eukprot:SAG31_NODE_283_length_18512_cov_19.352414_15_plen_66_part_00
MVPKWRNLKSEQDERNYTSKYHKHRRVENDLGVELPAVDAPVRSAGVVNVGRRVLNQNSKTTTAP